MLEEKRLAEADVARVRNDLSVLQLDIARRESYLLAETSKLKHLRGAVYTFSCSLHTFLLQYPNLNDESKNNLNLLLLTMRRMYHRRV